MFAIVTCFVYGMLAMQIAVRLHLHIEYVFCLLGVPDGSVYVSGSSGCDLEVRVWMVFFLGHKFNYYQLLQLSEEIS